MTSEDVTSSLETPSLPKWLFRSFVRHTIFAIGVSLFTFVLLLGAFLDLLNISTVNVVELIVILISSVVVAYVSINRFRHNKIPFTKVVYFQLIWLFFLNYLTIGWGVQRVWSGTTQPVSWFPGILTLWTIYNLVVLHHTYRTGRYVRLCFAIFAVSNMVISVFLDVSIMRTLPSIGPRLFPVRVSTSREEKECEGDTWISRGMLALETNDTLLAKQCYEKGLITYTTNIKNDPLELKNYLQRIFVLRLLRRNDEAREAIQEVEDKFPNNPWVIRARQLCENTFSTHWQYAIPESVEITGQSTGEITNRLSTNRVTAVPVAEAGPSR